MGMNRSFRAQVAIPLALVCLPLLVYGNTVFHRFGLRDDYSISREAAEEPGKLMRLFGGQGRPLYGWLLKISAGRTPDIADFCWLRAAGAITLGVVAAGLYFVLRRQRWPDGWAALAAALLVLLPSGQLIAGWGICWPHMVAAGLGLAAFAAAEQGLESVGLARRAAWLGLAAAAIVIGALDYQSSVMFYLAGVAAGLGRRLVAPGRQPVRWLAAHAGVLAAGLLLAFNVTTWLFAAGVYLRSPRIAIDLDLPAKFILYFRDALPNALALFVLNDEEARTGVLFVAALLVVPALLLAGVPWLLRRRGPGAALLWLVGLAGLPLAAYGVSLIAAERWVTYRTLYPCAAVVLMFALTVLDWLLPGRARPRLRLAGLAGLTLAAAIAARRQAYTLLARPQALELRLLETGARAIDPAQHPQVFVLTPDSLMAPAAVRWADEFGSLSMDSDWTPKEALKHLMRERFPGRPGVVDQYVYASGGAVPKGAHPDVVIDLRRIADYRGQVDAW
jgi:hypothetical protein